MALTLLCLWDGEKYPTVPTGFDIQVGWTFFAFCAALALLAWARAESVRRALFALDDPRTYAVLRIGFALMTLVCFLNLYPYWRMLWSDEGLFDLAYAQDRLGRSALRGWSPEDGFFDAWAVVAFLWHKPSFFYFAGSPDFVFGYMMVFFAVLLLYAAGFLSRITGVIAWFMMSGIYERNSLYLEGTDTVYRAFWFILLFAKTGHAWSIDNWWRCRRLAARGRTNEPIYRRVPAWPRYLFMLQLVAIYVTTGWLKTGQVWLNGDALYYALNMDHFYRFEHATQWVSSAFGLNLFRVNTWVTHWWEKLFFVPFVGMLLRFGLRHRDEPWHRAQNVLWRRALAWLCVLAIWGLGYWFLYQSTPYLLALRNDEPVHPGRALNQVHVAMGVVVPIFLVAWAALGLFPRRMFPGGRSLGPLTRWRPWLRLPELRFDRETLRAWVFGRRTWLVIGGIFHGFLAMFMNIGMFPFIMLMTYAAWVEGEEWQRFGQRVVARLRQRPRWAWAAPAWLDRALLDAQAPEDVRPRGRPIPDVILLVFGAIGAGLVWGKVEGVDWIPAATYWWLATILAVSAAFRLLRPPAGHGGRPALAAGAPYRALAFGFVVWHATAVAIQLFPGFPLYAKWRSRTDAVFGSWLQVTGTNQSWRMFAPNPPRANSFMKTVVVLDDGRRFDLRNNGYHYGEASGPPSRPNPWIINDRMRKMHRRMLGKSKWFLKYWAEYQCREWALEHGEMPEEVVITKLVTRIPPPEFISFWVPEEHRGKKHFSTGALSGQPYDPRKLRMTEHDVKQYKCPEDLPFYVKMRRGIPLTEADEREQARWLESRSRAFSQRKERWDERRDFGRWWAYAREQARKAQEREERAAARPKAAATRRAARPIRAGEEAEHGAR